MVPAFIVMMMICITTQTETEESSANIFFSSVAESLDRNEEFQLDSHGSRRILIQSIDIHSSLIDEKPFCDKRKAADCLPTRNGNPIDTCLMYERCRGNT